MCRVEVCQVKPGWAGLTRGWARRKKRKRKGPSGRGPARLARGGWRAGTGTAERAVEKAGGEKGQEACRERVSLKDD